LDIKIEWSAESATLDLLGKCIFISFVIHAWAGCQCHVSLAPTALACILGITSP